MTVRSAGTGSASNQAWRRSKAGTNVSRSGKPTRRTTYQCAPPGGRASGPRGVTPSSRRSGSSMSRSGKRSSSSAPRPCNRTRAPSGSPAGSRTRWVRSSLSPAGTRERLGRGELAVPGHRPAGGVRERDRVREVRVRLDLEHPDERLLGGGERVARAHELHALRSTVALKGELHRRRAAVAGDGHREAGCAAGGRHLRRADIPCDGGWGGVGLERDAVGDLGAAAGGL